MSNYNPDFRHVARLGADEFGDPEYSFVFIDGDGEKWPLGFAAERVQDEGEEDECRWFEGNFDTRRVDFESPEQLFSWGQRHGYFIEFE